jgi:hypothetical protein
MATAVVPPPSPHTRAPIVIRQIFISIDVILPDILLKNTGEPQAVICLNIALENRGFVNLSRVLPLKNGIIAINEQVLIEIETARAEPTTSIFKQSKKKLKSPKVARLEDIFMTILVFTYPLILR